MRIKFLISLTILILGSLFFYNSRAIPELGEENQVTTLPFEISNILGERAGKQQISIRVPILLYHYVEYVQDKGDTIRQSLNITPYTLISQIETLKQAGYTFITPSELTNALYEKSKLPQKVIILSFDDGYMDFYTDVFPILEKEQVKAVAYIVPDFLNRPNFMFTFQLQEVAKSSLVEIGAHTMDHVWLKGVSKETASYQIKQSRIELQKLTDTPINSFAYPYGAFDQQAAQFVRDAGFTNAMSTVPGIVNTKDTQYFLYRLRPGYRTGQDLIDYLKKDTFKPW